MGCVDERSPSHTTKRDIIIGLPEDFSVGMDLANIVSELVEVANTTVPSRRPTVLDAQADLQTIWGALPKHQSTLGQGQNSAVLLRKHHELQASFVCVPTSTHWAFDNKALSAALRLACTGARKNLGTLGTMITKAAFTFRMRRLTHSTRSKPVEQRSLSNVQFAVSNFGTLSMVRAATFHR